MSTDKQNNENELAMAILNGLSGPNACKAADERRRMIPLHIADQAVAACEKEIAALKAEVERLSEIVQTAHADLFSENARLKAEVERLTKVAQVNKAAAEAGRFSYEMVKMEVERLRKAGDAMAICLEAYNRCKPYDGPMTLDCLKSWLAAKEGKPSV